MERADKWSEERKYQTLLAILEEEEEESQQVDLKVMCSWVLRQFVLMKVELVVVGSLAVLGGGFWSATRGYTEVRRVRRCVVISDLARLASYCQGSS